LLAILAAIAILKSLPDNASKQEFETAVNQIPDEEQREIAKFFLLDDNMREMLKKKTAA
jgi:hypothetical protein